MFVFGVILYNLTLSVECNIEVEDKTEYYLNYVF